MKAYKKLTTAQDNSNGRPIVKCGDLYITGMEELSEVSIIDPETDCIVAHITMRKLNILGNGNWASPSDSNYHKPFKIVY